MLRVSGILSIVLLAVIIFGGIGTYNSIKEARINVDAQYGQVENQIHGHDGHHRVGTSYGVRRMRHSLTCIHEAEGGARLHHAHYLPLAGQARAIHGHLASQQIIKVVGKAALQKQLFVAFCFLDNNIVDKQLALFVGQRIP